MGYTYCFYISVDNPESFEVYKADAIRIHNQLKIRDWFPIFGKTDHSGSGGYGTGPKNSLLPEFASFTSVFPNFTFKLWMTYWDNTNLYVVEVKDTTLLSENTKDFESVELLPGLTTSISLDNLEIKNDITDWFI